MACIKEIIIRWCTVKLLASLTVVILCKKRNSTLMHMQHKQTLSQRAPRRPNVKSNIQLYNT